MNECSIWRSTIIIYAMPEWAKTSSSQHNVAIWDTWHCFHAVCARCWRTGACQTRRGWKPSKTNSKMPDSWLKKQTENTMRCEIGWDSQKSTAENVCQHCISWSSLATPYAICALMLPLFFLIFVDFFTSPFPPLGLFLWHFFMDAAMPWSYCMIYH